MVITYGNNDFYRIRFFEKYGIEINSMEKILRYVGVEQHFAEHVPNGRISFQHFYANGPLVRGDISSVRPLLTEPVPSYGNSISNCYCSKAYGYSCTDDDLIVTPACSLPNFHPEKRIRITHGIERTPKGLIYHIKRHGKDDVLKPILASRNGMRNYPVSKLPDGTIKYSNKVRFNLAGSKK